MEVSFPPLILEYITAQNAAEMERRRERVTGPLPEESLQHYLALVHGKDIYDRLAGELEGKSVPAPQHGQKENTG